MGPKKIAPVAGQMSMTSFFMKKPGGAAPAMDSTPAVKKSMDSSLSAQQRMLESGSTDRDESTPGDREAVPVGNSTSQAQQTPIVKSGAEAGKKPETEEDVVHAAGATSGSKSVKRRLEEFANDDGDEDDVVITKNSKSKKDTDKKGRRSKAAVRRRRRRL